jgi:hypothetical protein
VDALKARDPLLPAPPRAAAGRRGSAGAGEWRRRAWWLGGRRRCPIVLLRALFRPGPDLGLDGSNLDPFGLGGSPALASQGGGPGDAVVTGGAGPASPLCGGRVEAVDHGPRAQICRCSG